MLSRILVLDALPVSGRCDTDVWRGIWAAFDKIGGLAGNVEHIPYCDASSFIHAKGPALFAAYARPDACKAIVISANWSGQPVDISGQLDLKRLGIPEAHVLAVDLESGDNVRLDGAKLELRIPANDYRMVLVEALQE